MTDDPLDPQKLERDNEGRIQRQQIIPNKAVLPTQGRDVKRS
jgi:hypothetical protein